MIYLLLIVFCGLRSTYPSQTNSSFNSDLSGSAVKESSRAALDPCVSGWYRGGKKVWYIVLMTWKVQALGLSAAGVSEKNIGGVNLS